MGWSLVAECTAEAIQAPVDQHVPVLLGWVYRLPAGDYRQNRHLVGEGSRRLIRFTLSDSQLARQTQGFAKSDASLRRAITLSVHCWNARQMLRQLYPKYRRGLSEFMSLSIGTLSELRCKVKYRMHYGNHNSRSICQEGCWLPRSISLVTLLPSAFITHTPHRPSRLEMNAMRVPSGEKAGAPLCAP
jgi:hypothetical protein